MEDVTSPPASAATRPSSAGGRRHGADMAAVEVKGESSPPSEVLAPRRLLLTTLGILVVMMLAVAVVGYYFREPLERTSRAFVDALGGFGVALGYYLPDAFTLPLPNDVFAVLGLAGGLSFFEVCVYASFGSLIGGVTGYWIGRSLRKTKFVTRILNRGGGVAQRTLDRYGMAGVAVAAITPLPYSIFCWAAGAGKLSFKRFFLVSQLRFARVAGYLYLIQLGLWSVT